MQKYLARTFGCGLILASLVNGLAVDRFRAGPQPFIDPAGWLTLNLDRAVIGSGHRIVLTTAPPDFVPVADLLTDHPVVDGAIAGPNLYVVERVDGADRLGVLHLEDLGAGIEPLDLQPAPTAALRVATMDDFLVVAESGRGLRFLALPGHDHASGGVHGASHGPMEVGFHPLEDRIVAVATSQRTVHVAVEGGLVTIDARIPAAPGFVSRIDLGSEVRDLGANGSAVFALGRDGLAVLDVDGAAGTELHPDVRGDSLVLAGRSMWVAGGPSGVREFRDESTIAATIFIQVGDVFFSPAGAVNVNAGDRVQWQKDPTTFTHNVFSCNPGQAGCSGAQSTETFTSGPVTTSLFDFGHTFTLQGNNPYLCQSHITTMRGDIVVAAAASPPPGVSDGDGATDPVRVERLDAAGTDLRVTYDTGCTGAADHAILHGNRAQLPAAAGGTFGLSGSRCGIGTTSPFTWTATPPVASGDFLWWVIIADDGSGIEGSWGTDSGGIERDGPGINGSSGQCTHTDKDLTNSCGQ